jgi:NTE family protein
MRRALVLSGGSIKGAFQGGAVCEILKWGFVPDAIYGVSVGSLNGAFVAERAGRARRNDQNLDWSAIADELVRFWADNITSPDKVGHKRSGRQVAWNILWNKFDGFIDTEPLRKLVHDTFDEQNLRESPVYFAAGVVNIASGRYFDANIGFPNLLEYIIAGTSIPGTMPVSMVASQPLQDGGIRNVTPIGTAIHDGADDIICVVCQAENIAAATFNRHNILQYTERIMDIVINEIVNNDLEWARYINEYCPRDGRPVSDGPFAGYRYVPITVIRPAVPPHLDLTNFTAVQIADLIEVGRFAARSELAKRPRP